MIPLNPPQVDERDNDAVLAQVENRRPAYLPAWNPPDKSAGAALSQVYSRLAEAVLERLNQVPARDKLAFLDLLGFRMTPAQSSRAPITFKLNDGAPDSSAPKATQVAAPPPPGGSQQIVFETEEEIGVASAKLTQIVSLWPGRDQYVDHSAAYQAAKPFVLFEDLQLQPIPHVIYLAHSALLAFAGKAHLEVVFDLAQGASSPLDVIWEYWDGQVWRQFKSFQPSCLEAAEAGHDGTFGLTRDGSVRLDTDAAQTAQTTVNGVKSYWIRGRLDQPLPPNPAQLLPLADTIRLRTLIDQGLELKVGVSFANANTSFLKVVDEGGQVFLDSGHSVTTSAIINVRFTQTDDPSVVFDSSNVASWQFTSGKTYQVDVRFQTDVATQAMTGTAFAVYSLVNTRAGVTVVLKVEGLLPDKALFGGKNVDVTKSFYPLGQTPAPGSAFYFKQAEIFSKPGARTKLYVSGAPAPTSNPIDHVLNWEYWNGDEWTVLLQSVKSGTPAGDFTGTEVIEFTVPNDMRSTKVNNDDGFWIRVRLVSGGYGSTKTITLPAGASPPTVTFTQPQPPIVNRFCFGYSWVRGPEPLDWVFTYNDFQYEDQTNDARWPGNKFALFQPTDEVPPALYLGFNRILPVNNFGMYFDILEQSGADPGPDLTWEYWNGAGWQKLVAQDETQHLELPGIVTVLAESDSRALARFGQPLFWIRARLKEDAPPNQTTINNILPNAVWASQLRTSLNQPLGASDGSPNQMFQFTQIPVLPGQIIAVQELSGPRANTEWRLVALDVSGGDPSIVTELESLLAAEGTQTDVFSANGTIDLKRDKRKIVTEVWITWGEQENFFDSGPGDRHYVLDHAAGRLFFGDGNAGKIPRAGADIQATLYRSGGGLAGNVAAGTITQLLGAVSGVQGVTNPRAAEGGADGETLEEFAERAPQGIRNRDRAISLADYENLAHEASAGVAVARAIPTLEPNGVKLAGWVTLVIIPHSQEPRPMPSFGLREEVQSYLEQHAPGDVAQAHRIRVIGPSYLPVDVAATLAPKDVTQAGTVEQAARDALEKFLHPLYGGPAGRGWSLGRNVFLSDVASVLGDTAGVDFVSELSLSVNGVLLGEEVIVPHDQVVVAGELKLNLTAAV